MPPANLHFALCRTVCADCTHMQSTHSSAAHTHMYIDLCSTPYMRRWPSAWGGGTTIFQLFSFLRISCCLRTNTDVVIHCVRSAALRESACFLSCKLVRFAANVCVRKSATNFDIRRLMTGAAAAFAGAILVCCFDAGLIAGEEEDDDLQRCAHSHLRAKRQEEACPRSSRRAAI